MYSKTEPLTRDEEVDCVRRGDREGLIIAFLPLAKRIAERYARMIGFKYVDDFIQEGIVGLIKGIDNFELGHNTRVSMYVRICIKSHICRYISEKIKMVKIPVNIGEKIKEARKIIEENKSKDVDDYRLKNAIKVLEDGFTLNDYVSSDFSYDKHAYNRCAYYEVDCEKPDKLKQINKIFSKLNEKEIQFITLKFVHDYTLEEISRIMLGGVSRQRAGQIFNRIRRKMIHETF